MSQNMIALISNWLPLVIIVGLWFYMTHTNGNVKKINEEVIQINREIIVMQREQLNVAIQSLAALNTLIKAQEGKN